MKKKLIAALLILTMSAGLFAGCGNDVEKEVSSSKEQVSQSEKADSEEVSDVKSGWLVEEETTLTLFYPAEGEGAEDKWLWDIIREKTGIIVEPICYSVDIAKEKFSTYIASGELPDIMLGTFEVEELESYGAQGAIAAPSDYLDIMPNYKKLLIDDPDMKLLYDEYTTESGKNYQIPRYKFNRDVNHGNMYRADIFEKLEIEPWTDTDSFYNALVKLKEAYPDSYPLVTGSYKGTLKRYVNNFDLADILLHYDYESKEWFLSPTTDNFKEFLDFFKKLYAERLMDIEFFSSSSDAMTEMLLTDKGFICNEWIGRMAIINGAAKEGNPDTAFDLVYGYPIGNGKIQQLSQFDAGGNAVALNDKTEIAMKFVDWWYSDEGAEIITIGVEGDNFEWVDGKPVYPNMEAEATINTLYEEYGMWIGGMDARADHRSVYYAYTDHEQAAQDLINENCGYTRYNPAAKVAEEDTEEYAMLYTNLDSATWTFLSNYITNESYGEKEWNDFVQSIEKEYGKILEMLNK